MSNTTKTEATKARLNPGRQWIGIDNIILDERFQPRAKTDFEWVHDLSGHRKDGSEFPPVRVYQLPDGRLIAASGFHRIPAMKMAGEDQVLCDVVDGTEEDAIVFAAGSNKGNGVKPMGPKDVTKAVEMLLAVDAWWNRSSIAVGKHVGCGPSKVCSIRNKISHRDGRKLPEFIEAVDGKSMPFAQNKGISERRITRQVIGNTVRYTAKYKNNIVRSKTKEGAKEKIRALIDKDKNKSGIDGLMRFTTETCGFSGIFPAGHSGYPGLCGYYRKGMLVIPCDFSSQHALPLSIGRLVAVRRLKGDLAARMIVLCYPEDGPAKVIDLYKQEGFEFMTPEELAESLK